MAQSKPDFRTVTVDLPAPFEGWQATLKAEGISARILIELQSGDEGRAMTATKSLVVKNNFLTADGEPANDVLDAPMEALGAMLKAWTEAVAALPPR
jgi:hypothetical protein